MRKAIGFAVALPWVLMAGGTWLHGLGSILRALGHILP